MTVALVAVAEGRQVEALLTAFVLAFPGCQVLAVRQARHVGAPGNGGAIIAAYETLYVLDGAGQGLRFFELVFGGWGCAGDTEYVTAQAFLNEEHEGPEHVSPNDNNDYTLSKIGKHNVIITVLPNREYSTSRTASIASDIMHSFPNVRIGLMVSISSSAPSRKHDIRLGDIVVSAPRNGKSGVLQYDFSKTIQNRSFQQTGVLNQAPAVLRAAVNGLKAQYESKGHRHEEDINNILQKKPRLQKKYGRPGPSSDRLYQSEVVHPVDDDSSCVAACGTDLSKLIPRSERTQDEDNPTIHYGVIASGNQLMKDASVRDKLAAEEDILCFEMEAAGLMNHFPCLVIRGICDYSDSHKNKEWQGYAAMVAAAYTKDLLYRIAPNRVEAEKKIGEILSDLHEVAEEHRDVARENCNITKEILQAQKDLAKERLRDATYEWYKDRVEARVEGTYIWFLKHENFQTWLNQESGPLLVLADPGYQDQNTVRQALCALLHQLFSQKPSLIEHAIIQFRKDGQGLINSTESLWKVLRNAMKDPQAGPIIIVLDALDECNPLEFPDLMRNVESQFRSDQLGHSKPKYLLTCRPYKQIVSKFRRLLGAFPNIRIPGEEESETISQEVNRVITHRVNQLPLSPNIKSHLEKRLRGITHRTYLWAYLVFDNLEEDDFIKTPTGVQSAIAALPTSVNQAYDQILNKSKSEERPIVRKVLSIILAASRPLTLSEMKIAVNIDATSQSIHDIGLEDKEDFKSRLRSYKIYFLHQTAREFLLADLASPTTVPSGLRWHHSITKHHAHAVLAEACVLYLNFFNSDVSLPTDANVEAGHSVDSWFVDSDSDDSYAFLDYSAKTWGAHFREAGIIDNAAIIPFALRICDPDSKSYTVWFRIYWKTTRIRTTKYFTDLMLASYYGHHVVVKVLLEKGDDIDSKDNDDTTGHEAIVKLLLEKGADVESKGKNGRTPLSWAAEKGHEAIVKLLLEKGADVESKGNKCRTPLLWAAQTGRDAIVKLLLEKGADVESKDKDGRTPLSWAAEKGHEAIAKLLQRKSQ
ncbi:hypothetical protein EDB81DRAFT_845400 [Dactylonectria macrodidyma]|uniref:Nucleoside phosphorylase domain-containing protein n=1 Tax=Dactylonectria macrodidyma TaxID=307937 RepID=A0A9P9IRP5_9HYPO|nr:hypothetical protein EDB81DRAFT_845400 [Dactylonectria macrodidyma]